MNKQGLIISREELQRLLADCNNCIMNGSFKGDEMIEAVDLMFKLTELHDLLSEGLELDLTSEGIEYGRKDR